MRRSIWVDSPRASVRSPAQVPSPTTAPPRRWRPAAIIVPALSAGIIRNGSGTVALSKSGAGTLTLAGANTYTGTTTINAGTLTLSGSLDVGSNTATTVVASGATLSGTGVLTAASLADSGVGAISLTGNNAVGAVSTTGAGSFRFNDDQSLSLSSMNATGPIAVTTTLGSGANITLSSGAALSSSASGDAIVLAAAGAFINNAGSAVLSAANGRWVVYSAAPGADAFGGLNSGNTAVWDANYGGTISQSGDRYVFAFQPTVTFTSSNASKIYGTDDTAAVAADYTVSALQPGVTGAFLGDSAATAFSGAPVVTSAGSAATATVTGGSYPITVAMGSLAGLNGYAVAVASPGNLTVTPASLTITAGRSVEGVREQCQPRHDGVYHFRSAELRYDHRRHAGEHRRSSDCQRGHLCADVK